MIILKQYKLHYAEVDNHKDIPCLEFRTHYDMVDFIDAATYKKKNVVFLLCQENNPTILVTEKYLVVEEFLNRIPTWECVNDYYLQEYYSYEEAYIVALGMQEENPLCYEDDK
tara:strand:+ start:55 stop:393 length:339 start_codon:yes stop_codon:yes gene_type:complete